MPGGYPEETKLFARRVLGGNQIVCPVSIRRNHGNKDGDDDDGKDDGDKDHC